jgi:hypothetical protein
VSTRLPPPRHRRAAPTKHAQGAAAAPISPQVLMIFSSVDAYLLTPSLCSSLGCACVDRVAGWGGAPSWHRRYQAGDDEGHQAHDAEAATIERTLGNDKKVQLLAGAIPPSSAPLGVRSSGSKLSSMQSRRARNQRSQKQARCVLPTRATQPPRHFATAVAAAIPPTTAAHPPCSLHSPAATPLSGGWRLRLWSRSRVRYFHCRAKFQFVSGCNEGTRLSMHETLRGVMRATSCPGNWG